MESVFARCRDSAWGGPSLRLATVSRWADEDPQAMAWLLSDAALQRLLAVALHDVTDLENDNKREEETKSG